MQIDKNMLNRLLMMNDEQLGSLIRQIAEESGIDPSALGINTENIAGIRRALGAASDEDLKQLNGLYESYRQNKK